MSIIEPPTTWFRNSRGREQQPLLLAFRVGEGGGSVRTLAASSMATTTPRTDGEREGR
jgi:hypothetical protein